MSAAIAASATESPARATVQDVYRLGFEGVVRRREGREPRSLTALRAQAFERFSHIGFPGKRDEEWRFTDISPIARSGFRLGAETPSVSAEAIEKYRYSGTHELVFINGRFSAEHSQIEALPEGVVVGSLADALANTPERLEGHLARHAKFEIHPFVALNTALFEDGALIRVPKGVIVDRPINIIHVGRPEGEAFACFPRHMLIAEESSQVTVVEQYGSVGEGAYLTCPVIEVSTEDNAVIDHYKLQRESTDAFHVSTFQLHQLRDSNFSSHSISWGGGLVRNDVNAILAGEGCESTLNGLYMVEGSQLVDNHMRVEHKAAHCDSHELFKGILEGRARAVFNGRIYVHKGAQKTDAKQTNRNLLLSPTALCNSHPQLEIFADDVKCTHGSTVGQLDETAVFYLRSRGIGEEAAKSLLTYAFAADIVGRIKVPEVRRDLEEFLFRRLPRGEVVRQAV
ncbi:MAG: Fe-S cluster assembly protein SufD [Acidobacteriota bacterium]|nr:Fe-S cluster assembly protein SufD [Acidobacteriota bacterium]